LAAARPTRHGRWLAAGILAVALFLRVWPIDHGLPRRYVPDDHAIKNALGMARDRDLLPAMGTYSTYPYLVSYALLPLYAGQYALGRIQGRWGGVDEYGELLLDAPGLAQRPARLLVGVLGALTALAVLAVAREAGLGIGAPLAAWLTATSLLSVQLSTHARPWVPLVLCAALALWRAIAFARRGRPRDLLLASAAAGLGFACHQAGLALLAIPGAAWLLSPGWRARELVPRAGRGALAVVVFALVALVTGYGYFLKHGGTAPERVVGTEIDVEKLSIGGQATVLGVSLDSAATLSAKLFGYDPALVALGLWGAALAWRRRELRAAWLAFALIGGFFLTNPSDHVRYLLPATPFLALFAGLAAERLVASAVGRALLALACALPLVQALRLGWLLRQEDTRAEAERVLAELPPSALVAIDHYGPTPDLSLPALQRLFELRPLHSREAHRAERLQNGELPPDAGLDAIGVEELFEVHPRTGAYGVRPALAARGATPAAVLTTLGVTHLVLVDRRPTRDDPWLADVARAGRVRVTFNPGKAGATPREAFLPTEMDFPLTGLWQVSRPGPWMQLVEL
jgi:hypothetical protein